jgi:hypothetical protein
VRTKKKRRSKQYLTFITNYRLAKWSASSELFEEKITKRYVGLLDIL